MPEMDGCSASRTIRALLREDAQSVAIVAMTANVFREDVEKALNAGMDGHIGKPPEVDSVLSTLKRLVGREGDT